MELAVAQTEQSVYVIAAEQDFLTGDIIQRVVSRTPVGIDGLAYEQGSVPFAGRINGHVEVGQRFSFVRDEDGHTITTTPVVTLVCLTHPACASLHAFDEVAETVLVLGSAIGFEGVSRKQGLKSVEAIMLDLRRAVANP